MNQKPQEVGGPRKKNWIGKIPKVIWDPVVASILIFAVGGIACLAKQPWLFPSLGAMAYVMSHQPGQKTANLYHALVGNWVAVPIAYLAVLIVGAWDSPSLPMNVHPTALRFAASALGIAMVMLVQILLRSVELGAGATTLLITLGAFQENWHDAMALIIGIGIIVAMGEVFRLLRLRGTGGHESGWP